MCAILISVSQAIGEKAIFDSMYKGKNRFDRDQLVFVVNVILCGALDRIECCLPPTIPVEEFRENEDDIETWCKSAMETAGMTLAVLWAQLELDGVSAGDALEESGLIKLVKELVCQRTSSDFKGFKLGIPCFPDTKPLAESFVDKMFYDYLRT